jgi:hypothetical protein
MDGPISAYGTAAQTVVVTGLLDEAANRCSYLKVDPCNASRADLELRLSGSGEAHHREAGDQHGPKRSS